MSVMYFLSFLLDQIASVLFPLVSLFIHILIA